MGLARAIAVCVLLIGLAILVIGFVALASLLEAVGAGL